MLVRQHIKPFKGKCRKGKAQHNGKGDVEDGFFHGNSFDGAEAPVDYFKNFV